MTEQTYKSLARRLARHLTQIVVTERPELIVGDGDYDRLFELAERTLEAFKQHERAQRLKVNHWLPVPPAPQERKT